MINYINHIAILLDASGSMVRRTADVIKVTEAQIEYLAQRSKDLDQETRVSIYQFSGRHQIQCLIYDKDVLRLPKVPYKNLNGQTALLDATNKVLKDLAATPELYGEHAFLLYVLTDGEENNSALSGQALRKTLDALPDHWTVALFVPDQRGVFSAKQIGFPAGNIAVWDASSTRGVEDAAGSIKQATENFMQGRQSGMRGSRNLFTLNTANVSKSTVKALTRLGPGQFRLLAVHREQPIADFVEDVTRRSYKIGEAYYQLTKSVEVQPQKEVALYNRKEHTVYTGADARQLLGLPNHSVKVAPAALPDFDIFIQSTSVNRKLMVGTSVLLLS